MTRQQIGGWAVAAVTVFWAVGAYNRLIGLRNRIVVGFGAVDAQIQKRHALVLRWLEAASPVAEPAPDAQDASPPVNGQPAGGAATTSVSDPPQPAETLRAAGQQLLIACDALRGRPSAARRAVSLRLAEQTLVAARLRFGAGLPGRAAAADDARLAGAESVLPAGALVDELTAADSTFVFACQQFNDATNGYNDALRQFPTRLVGWLFGFREAGTL